MYSHIHRASGLAEVIWQRCAAWEFPSESCGLEDSRGEDVGIEH